MNLKSTILLVEDDPNDVYFATRALRAVGLHNHLQVVADGNAAINYLTNATGNPEHSSPPLPHLVLLDLNIPYKSGLDVLKWVRQESRCPTIVVIVLTSSTAECDINQAYRLGANSYVIKPSDATRLRDLGEHLKSYWFGWNQFPPVR